MRRSTTSAVTERPLLGLLLLVELIVAAVLLAHPFAGLTGPQRTDHASSLAVTVAPPIVPSDALVLRDGRTVSLLALGGNRTADLAARITAELDGAADAVTAFWGNDWRRNIVVVLTGTDDEFQSLAAGGSDIAAATTTDRIVFAPGASAMGDAALRIVVRHELFHYAARGRTAADAPRWLTEGVADFVGRPPTAMPGPRLAAEYAQLPSDVDLDTAGDVRSLAYDRAWWFSRFVASRYGAEVLRQLYVLACGPGHPDAATAIQRTLDTDRPQVLAAWRNWLSG